MKLHLKCIAFFVALFILSCNKGNKSNNYKAEATTRDIILEDAPKAKEGITANSGATESTNTAAADQRILQAGQPVPFIDWDKKIIKTANVTLELKDFNAFNQTIHAGTKQFGAYISGEQQTEQDGKIENNIIIKVPVDQFEALMNALPTEGVKLIDKSITTEDVTGEVLDTKSRMEAKKQVRDRYLDLLKQAKNMKDILQVQGEINIIQEEIEAGAGRVNYLNHQATYSTINLKYYQLIATTFKPTSEPSFFTRVTQAFSDGASIVKGIIILAITFWPILLGAFFTWLLFRKYSFKSAALAKKLKV